MGAEPTEAVEDSLPVVGMIEQGERFPRQPVAQPGKAGERRFHGGIEPSRLRGFADHRKSIGACRDTDADRRPVPAELAISRLVPENLVTYAAPGARSGLQGLDPGPHPFEALAQLSGRRTAQFERQRKLQGSIAHGTPGLAEGNGTGEQTALVP